MQPPAGAAYKPFARAVGWTPGVRTTAGIALKLDCRVTDGAVVVVIVRVRNDEDAVCDGDTDFAFVGVTVVERVVFGVAVGGGAAEGEGSTLPMIKRPAGSISPGV